MLAVAGESTATSIAKEPCNHHFNKIMAEEKQTLVIIDAKYVREPCSDLLKHDHSLNDCCFLAVKQSWAETLLKCGIMY
jgi:hypothetical protein